MTSGCFTVFFGGGYDEHYITPRVCTGSAKTETGAYGRALLSSIVALFNKKTGVCVYQHTSRERSLSYQRRYLRINPATRARVRILDHERLNMSKSNSLNPVTPVNPVAPYIGGKRNLAKRLCAHIETIPHTLYAEAFVGMGGVFLRRKFHPKTEVINDFSRDVTTLFRILQRHYPQFLDTLKYQITSRSEFERLKKTDPDTLTDLERAARFLYLQRTSFGGKVTGQNFGVTFDRGARFNLTSLVPMLEDIHERLSGVIIECLHFAEFITRYDRPLALFYLDPPYYNCEEDYGKGLFSKEDFAVLAKVLSGLQGKFLLSLNDVPAVREIFSGFNMEPVNTTYSLNKNKAVKVGELIISN